MQRLAYVLVKIGGFALIIYGLLSTGEYGPQLLAQPENFTAGVVVSIFIGYVFLPIVIGMCLIQFGGIVARYLVPSLEPLENTNTSSALETAGIAILGVFLFYQALSDAVYLIASIYQNIRLIPTDVINKPIVELIAPQQYGNMMATIAEILFALWMIMGANGMVRLFNRFREREG